MSVIRKFVILEDRQKSLETTIDFLLNCKEYSWDKIYLFSAFVSDDGVKKVKKILEHPYLNENTEFVIAMGTKNSFNKPSDIENLLNFIDKKSMNVKAKSVRFICPTNNFHVKAYCFLGRHVRDNDNREIGFSIIGSSNLTKVGLECEGELCISIHNLNLTKGLIDRWSNKYKSESHLWNQLRIKEYERQYNKEHSRKDQDEVIPPSQENSTPVNQDQAPITSTPPNGKFIKLGVINDIALIDKKKSLLDDYSEDAINAFYSSRETIDQVKNDFLVGSLCLSVDIENIFRIVEIVKIIPYPYKTEQNEIKGGFVIFRENVTYEPSDIGEILANEKYKIISDAKNMDKLPYKTLKDLEEEVKKMLNDPNYKKGLEKGKKKMQKMQLEEIDELLKINDIDLIKEKLKELKESYSM
ncbi:restriction endonuclease PLD domain-containing protein [Microcoleus sp. B4-D4]|uniref:restriction endonuclease PLD domain-containing protein n=1 Tax=Microcoleus sp. B4-D4 TaxID=2818667 RepID=UPI002FD145DD